MKGIKGILLMAGQGSRFGDELPKQFQPLGDKKIYQWPLQIFFESKLFEEILLVCPPRWVETVQSEVGHMATVLPGGDTRQESSYLGLLRAGSRAEIVLIHDAARPFVTPRILRENIEGARRFGAVDTCIPSADTLAHAPQRDKITSIPPRSEWLRGQTPQTFSYPLIIEAHQKTKQTSASDDCQLVLELGHKVHVVWGEEENFKITSPRDLWLAEMQLQCTEETMVKSRP